MKKSIQRAHPGHSPPFGWLYPFLSAAFVVSTGCGDAPGGGTDEVGDGDCEATTGVVIEGEWSPTVEDWSQAGDLTPKASPYDDIVPHHPYLTAVHTIHLPYDELQAPPDKPDWKPALLMFHGEHEERVWEIGSSAPGEMGWFPIGHMVDWEEDCDTNDPPNCTSVEGYPDIFCSGHILLEDGRVLVAGGNVTGSGSGGGLVQTFTFNRMTADANEANPNPDPQPFLAMRCRASSPGTAARRSTRTSARLVHGVRLRWTIC